MNAITLLTDEHDEMKKLMADLDETTERGVKIRNELFDKLKARLEIHEAIEEEIFYPALKKHPKAKDIVLEGIEEHHVVDGIVAELETLSVQDETWGAKLTVMKENVEHHMEEEESDMFPKARDVFDGDELTELGDRMQVRKMQLQEAG
ncbi:MAG: hemerythrin domain-containing protein [Actinomycetota bacterium]